ncbi:MAG: hypothetical protein U0528_01640 [Anaerolineae bacterium]
MNEQNNGLEAGGRYHFALLIVAADPLIILLPTPAAACSAFPTYTLADGNVTFAYNQSGAKANVIRNASSQQTRQTNTHRGAAKLLPKDYV